MAISHIVSVVRQPNGRWRAWRGDPAASLYVVAYGSTRDEAIAALPPHSETDKALSIVEMQAQRDAQNLPRMTAQQIADLALQSDRLARQMKTAYARYHADAIADECARRAREKRK